MRTAFLDDRRIQPTEYSRWADAHRRFATREADRKIMANLMETLPLEGLREPILLGVHAKYPDVYVADGHHRAVALRELGIREFPFHWCYIKGGSTRRREEPFPYHLLGL